MKEKVTSVDVMEAFADSKTIEVEISSRGRGDSWFVWEGVMSWDQARKMARELVEEIDAALVDQMQEDDDELDNPDGDEREATRELDELDWDELDWNGLDYRRAEDNEIWEDWYHAVNRGPGEWVLYVSGSKELTEGARGVGVWPNFDELARDVERKLRV